MSGGTGGPFVLGHRCASSQNQQGAGPPLDGLLLWRQGLATLQTPSVGPRFHHSPPPTPQTGRALAGRHCSQQVNCNGGRHLSQARPAPIKAFP